MPDIPFDFSVSDPGEEISVGEVANVEVSVVPSLPGLPENISPNSLGYLAYGHSVQVLRDSGLRAQVAMGAKREVAADVVRVHTGSAIKHITFTVLRVGQKPVTPSQKASGANELRLTSSVLTFNPARLPDGSPVFCSVGTVTMVLLMPPADEDELEFPMTALDIEAGGTYTLTSGDITEYFRQAAAVTGAPGQKIEF